MTARTPNTITVNGKRKVCRIFDTGPDGPVDRYTIAFKGFRDSSSRDRDLVYPYLAANDAPFHPLGFGQHGESRTFLTGRHLGRRTRFEDLPEQVQRFVLQNI